MFRWAVAPLAQQDTNWSAAPRNAAVRRRKIVLPTRGHTACHCMFTFCSSLLLGVPAVPARYSATHNDEFSHSAKAAADPGALLVVPLRRRYTPARAPARGPSPITNPQRTQAPWTRATVGVNQALSRCGWLHGPAVGQTAARAGGFGDVVGMSRVCPVLASQPLPSTSCPLFLSAHDPGAPIPRSLMPQIDCSWPI